MVQWTFLKIYKTTLKSDFFSLLTALLSYNLHPYNSPTVSAQFTDFWLVYIVVPPFEERFNFEPEEFFLFSVWGEFFTFYCETKFFLNNDQCNSLVMFQNHACFSVLEIPIVLKKASIYQQPEFETKVVFFLHLY